MFFLMICSLSTTFFYQNCSELESTPTASASQIEYLPLYTNQMKLFEGSKQTSGCSKINEVLYSSAHNLCFEVSDSCAYSALLQNGFRLIEKGLEDKVVPDPVVIDLDSKDTGTLNLSSQNQSSSFMESTNNDDLESRIKNCQIFVDINDLKPDDFLVVDVNSLGYLPKSEEVCSMSLQPMVNFKSRTCLTAIDGCQSAFLKKLGYVNDYFSICPQSL